MTLSVNTAAEITLTLNPTTHAQERNIYKRLQTSSTVEAALGFLNSTFVTPNNIALHFGSYERIWYENNTIEIPYDFIYSIRQGYKHTRIPHRFFSLDEFTGNTLFHVIFHETAHALIDQYDLPVLGKEEDAADALADVLLIHFFEDGADIVISAADLFYLDTQHSDGFSNEDYWSEHSIAPQRYYARLCHAYGSDPARYVSLKRRAGFSDTRAKRCIRQYEEVKRSWLRLLEPAFTTEP